MGGSAEKAASLAFDRKLCKKSREKPSFYAKQHTAFRNDVKNSLLDVMPCDLGEA